MTRLIRFLRRSVGEIRHSVKTYIRKSIVVPCQACSNHVHIRVMDFLAEPEKPMEIKCTKCDHTVCFTTKQPTVRSMTVGRIDPESSGSYYRPEWTTYNQPLSLETRTIHPQNDSNIGQSFHQDLMVDSGRPVSYTTSVNSKARSQPVPRLKQGTSNRSVLFSDSLQTFYGGLNSTSNDGSNEYSEDQDSTIGQSYSLRSSISLTRRPSLPHPSVMLGFDQCWEKTGASNPSWSTSVPPWLRSTSPQPASPPSPSDSPHPSFSDEKAPKGYDLMGPIELERCDDGHTPEFFLNYRGSRESIDLTPGKADTKSHSGRGSDQLAQLHLFVVDSDTEKHSESTLAIDSDRGSIRGNISEKRRGKLPQRSNAIHRAAVSRRHSQKIEQQEQQEQQYEAEKLSAKRRNSLNSDFEVEPSDEQVRQAQKIYVDAKQQQLPYQEVDIQWARGILRARKNWETLRYEHPLIGSMEQLQLKPKSSVEPTISPHYSEPIRHPLPFTVPGSSNMSPRMSRLSLQPLPTPVKEEPEGDTQALELVTNLPPPFPPGSTGSVGPPPNPLEISNTELEKATTSGGQVAPKSATGRYELGHSSGKGGLDTGSTNSAGISLPKRKNTSTRCRGGLRNIARKISCFHGVASPLPLPPTTIPQAPPQAPPAIIPNVAAIITPEVEMTSAEEHRSSGEIRDVPTSEEPFRLVGDAITSLVESMRIPFVEIQIQARPEDLFVR